MDKITIHGYKSLRRLELQLQGINILIGANGVGKSNLLSAFEMLNALYEQRLKEYVALNGGTASFLHKGPKVTQTLGMQLSFGTQHYQFDLRAGEEHFVFVSERLGEADGEISSFGTESRLKTWTESGDGIDEIKEYLAQIRKYHFHDAGKSSPFVRDYSVEDDKFFLYADGGNLAPYLFRLRAEAPLVYQRMVRVVQSVAPYFSDFYFQPNEAGLIRLRWTDKFSDAVYGPGSLSDGTVRFIALTALFLQPNPPRVVVIDEPELGLHPVAIGKLAGLIRSAAERGTQVIVATQSADLISHFRPEEVLTVNLCDGESAVRRLDSEGLSRWLEDYTLGDLWRQNILQGGQPR